MMHVMAAPTRMVPIIIELKLKIRNQDPMAMISMATASTNSLPQRWASDETGEDRTAKQIRGMVVKIPKLLGTTWKLAAMGLITDGMAVMGIRMQTPNKMMPTSKNELCFFTLIGLQ